MGLLKKIWRFLQFHDWIWSIIIAFTCYWLLNWGPPVVGDVAMTYYAINWIQPLIATGGVMAGLFFIARVGLWFNLRVLHRYIYPKKKYFGDDKEEQVSEKKERYLDFKNLQPWQKLAFSSFWLALFLVVAALVFLKFLSAAVPVA